MTALESFLELKETLRGSPVGGGGVDTSRALTVSLDATLIELAGDLSDEPVAVLAVGGYGRREQCIHSDVDVTILHEGANLDGLARRILYPLWDAGLKVGHAFRTINESNAAGKERLDTLTSQLSARLIVGDEDLFEGFLTGLVKTLSKTPLVPELSALEAERRQADPYQIMAADVKKGRGALRTYQGFWWDRRRSHLLGLDVEAETEDETAAVDDLLAVRNGLHAVSGRALDRYAFEAREPVAEWLSSDMMTVSQRLYRALALGDRLAEQRWPGVLTPDGTRSRRLLRGLKPKPAKRPSGPLEAAVNLIDRPERIQAAIATTASEGWTTAERDSLLRLIGAGHRGRTAFVQLEEAGWVEKQFPEWSPITALPQLAPFHEHPVDAHLWRTADEMAALLEDGDTFRSALVAELGDDDALLLAAFLHDIGKGRGGDHSVLGAEAAEGFLSRAGFGSVTTEAVSLSIRHHLLLIRTATRMDIADPRVLDEIAEAVADLRLLQMLYLLTIADTKATGAHMWSDWKETLLTQLFMRVAERMTGTGSSVGIRPEEVAVMTEEGSMAEVEEHLAGLPPDYVQFMSTPDVAWHLDSLQSLSEDHTSLSVDRTGQRVLAAGRDRRGFLLAVCKAFAAHGVGIHDARIYTRSDGIAIDTFHVLNDRTGETVAGDVWPDVAHTLEEIEASGLDVSPRVRHRAEAYDPKVSGGVEVSLRPELSDRHLAIEVRSPDRIGLLADLVAILYEEGLDLQLARIDTRGTEAIDVLYLDRETAPSEEDDLETLCRRIEAELSDVPD